MKTLMTIALVGAPVALTLAGNDQAGMVSVAAVVGGLCWLVSGWFTE